LQQQEVRPSFGRFPRYCMQLILSQAFAAIQGGARFFEKMSHKAKA
jgi:hypothetical protein